MFLFCKCSSGFLSDAAAAQAYVGGKKKAANWMPTEIYLSRETPALQQGQEPDTTGSAAPSSQEEAAFCWSAHQI